MTVFRRRPGIASVAALAAIATSLAAAHALAPGWARSAGLDVWNFAAEEAHYQTLLDERDDLAVQHERLGYQVAAGESLARRVAAGRVPLSEAADELLHVNRDRPGFLCGLRRDYRTARNDRELIARYLIRKVGQLQADPARRARETARLEAEYRAMIEQR